jgi:cytochrome P450
MTTLSDSLKTSDLNSKGERRMTEAQISIETANLVFAGTDTMSTTITYLLWQLAQCRWQERLREELSTVVYSNGIPSFSSVDSCPILDAVISEVLRMYPAAPSSLQRDTPAEGRCLSGYFIPGGVSQMS